MNASVADAVDGYKKKVKWQKQNNQNSSQNMLDRRDSRWISVLFTDGTLVDNQILQSPSTLQCSAARGFF